MIALQIKYQIIKYAKIMSYKKIFRTTYDDVNLTTSIIKNTFEYSRFISEKNSIPITSLRTALPFALGDFQQHIVVLDFGGGAGTTYFEAKHFFPEKDFEWIILETKTMVNMAQTSNYSNNELKFISDFAELDDIEIDLVIANSSLQYTDNPTEYLNKLINLKAKYLYITRMPLANIGPIKVQQTSKLGDNGPQINGKSVDKTMISIQATVVTRNEFEETLARYYQVKHRFLEEKGSFHGSGKSFDLFGYFCVIVVH